MINTTLPRYLGTVRGRQLLSVLFRRRTFSRHAVLLLEVLQARGEEETTRPGPLGRAHGDDAPQDHDGDAQDGAEDLEEEAGHLDAEGDGADGVDAQGEGEAPPAHVEGERAGRVDGGQGEDEPHEAEPPHDESHEDAKDVQDVPGQGEGEGVGGGRPGEEVDPRKDLARHSTQVHDGVTSHACLSTGSAIEVSF